MADLPLSVERREEDEEREYECMNVKTKTKMLSMQGNSPCISVFLGISPSVLISVLDLQTRDRSFG